MQGFIANLLHDTGMTDANTVRNPLTDKFTLSRKDEPQSDADRQEVVAHVNRQFDTDYSATFPPSPPTGACFCASHRTVVMAVAKS